MIRTPLRPLARILDARNRGENPDAIERENIRLRHEDMRDRARRRAEGRLLVLAVMFFGAFGVVGGRMAVLASSEPGEPRTSVAGAQIQAQRADIVDREGRILATNFDTHSLYAQPQQMVDPETAAEKLAAIFPDLDHDDLLKDFTGKRKFLWIKRKLSPEQKQAVHDIGEPGLLFGPREMRLYPNGRLAAHVLGGAGFGREGVHAAEVIGVAGIERFFDERLRDPARAHEPLTLSLDLSVQAAMERVLYGGMKIMNAKGAVGILMNVHTGEVTEVPCKGFFVAIGHAPSSELVVDQLKTYAGGYVWVEPGTTRTSVPGVFAAGDLTDHVYRQAVTSAGMGCMAALDAEKFLSEAEAIIAEAAE